MSDKSAEQSPELPVREWADFLEATPPGVMCGIQPIGEVIYFTGGSKGWEIPPTELQLHCGNKACGGPRFFECTSGKIQVNRGKEAFLTYKCRNCKETVKTYAVRVFHRGDDPLGIAIKFGELPTFGPTVPSRVISLIGPDRELFLKGRRAENLGLGIGAFAYYRRVVENQKGRLLAEIRKVAVRLNASKPVLDRFDAAMTETQFSKAIDLVKDGIPQALLINGHNPLSLLHSALSEGLHEQPEDVCLDLAQSIRIVLTELAERIGQALKDETELRDAVKRLMSRHESGSTEQPGETGGAGPLGTASGPDAPDAES